MADFQLNMQSRGPCLCLVVGITQYGKTTLINRVLSEHRGKSFAIDCNAPLPPGRPEPKHMAAWSDYYAHEPPPIAELPADVDLVVCDEAPRFPWKQFPLLEQLTLRGQHTGPRGCSFILASQRAMRIDINARSQAKRVYIFRQRDAADLEFLRGLEGMKGTPEGTLAMEIIPCLQPGYCVVWDEDLGLFFPKGGY